MRQFNRYPSDIPIDFKLCSTDMSNQDLLKNYSEDGLCFTTDSRVEPDAEIQITIPISFSEFHTTATVVWCKYINGKYEVGIKFLDAEVEYALGMFEQIGQIEQYKQKMLMNEGRSLSGEEAAKEWMAQYAGSIPKC